METETPNPDRDSLRVTVTPEDLKAEREREAAEKKASENAQITQTGSDTTDEKPARPDWVPEEFWNAEKGEADYEAMARGYADLKSKQAPPDPEKKADPPAATDDAANAALQERANSEFEKDGKLSDETYAEYQKRGVTREHIDTYIAGVQAIVAQQQARAYEEVGGEEAYKGMIEWARTALTKEEIAAYDRAVQSNDDAERLNAVRGLGARFASANGRDGRLLTSTKSAGGSSGDLFESKAQLVAAMSDPKYQKDSAYRDEVQAKLDRSLRAGKVLGI